MTGRGRYKGYNMNAFRKDLISGTIVGVIAIPLGMAFAIASGVKPEYGIYTTIVAGICISLFGDRNFRLVDRQVHLFLSCSPLGCSMVMRTCC